MCEKVRELQTESLSIELKTVGNGLEVIREIHHGQYDLLVVDFILPELDGLTVSRVLKSVPDWKRTPIILVSDILDDDITKICSDLGVEACFMKPFEKDVFLKAIMDIWHSTKENQSEQESVEALVKEMVEMVTCRLGEMLERTIHFKDFQPVGNQPESKKWDRVYSLGSEEYQVVIGLPAAIGSVGKGLVEILKTEFRGFSSSGDHEVHFFENCTLPEYDPSCESHCLKFETQGHPFELQIRRPALTVSSPATS